MLITDNQDNERKLLETRYQNKAIKNGYFKEYESLKTLADKFNTILNSNMAKELLTEEKINQINQKKLLQDKIQTTNNVLDTIYRQNTTLKKDQDLISKGLRNVIRYKDEKKEDEEVDKNKKEKFSKLINLNKKLSSIIDIMGQVTQQKPEAMKLYDQYMGERVKTENKDKKNAVKTVKITEKFQKFRNNTPLQEDSSITPPAMLSIPSRQQSKIQNRTIGR